MNPGRDLNDGWRTLVDPTGPDSLAQVTIFWDEFEILRLLDACDKGESGGIMNGVDLAQKLAADRGQPLVEQDLASLIRELFVLHSAGLVTWIVMSSHGRVRQISPNEPHDYLNHLRDFALTVRGRDRARGQMLQVPMPEQGEDDGRMIASLTLEDVARIIGGVYAPFQAMRLLIESGISPGHDSGEEGETWERLLRIFVELSLGTSGQRSELRYFLGAWLADRLHTGPFEEQRMKIEGDLARQGWFVSDGRLVVGEPVRNGSTRAGTPTPTVGELHAAVSQASEPRWRVGHLHGAVLAAAKAVNAMLQRKLKRYDIAEVALVREAFSQNAAAKGRPRLRFPGIEDETTRESMQQGALSFGVGCFQAIRNPVGHLPDEQHELTEQDALERLAALSLLARWIDQATLTGADE